jgi:hypothetical protein
MGYPHLLSIRHLEMPIRIGEVTPHAVRDQVEVTVRLIRYTHIRLLYPIEVVLEDTLHAHLLHLTRIHQDVHRPRQFDLLQYLHGHVLALLHAAYVYAALGAPTQEVLPIYLDVFQINTGDASSIFKELNHLVDTHLFSIIIIIILLITLTLLLTILLLCLLCLILTNTLLEEGGQDHESGHLCTTDSDIIYCE